MNNNINLECFWAMKDDEYISTFKEVSNQYEVLKFTKLELDKENLLDSNKIKTESVLIISGSSFRTNKKHILENKYIFKVYIFDKKHYLHKGLNDEYELVTLCTNDTDLIVQELDEDIEIFNQLSATQEKNELIFSCLKPEVANEYIYGKLKKSFPEKQINIRDLDDLLDNIDDYQGKRLTILIGESESQDNIDFILKQDQIKNIIVYFFDEEKINKNLKESKKLKLISENFNEIKEKILQLTEFKKNKLKSCHINIEGKDFINLTNISDYNIYARLTSPDNKDNILNKIPKSTTFTWKRPKGKRFLLQIERINNNLNGPLYLVDISNQYEFDHMNGLYCIDRQDFVPLSDEDFEDNIEDCDNCDKKTVVDVTNYIGLDCLTINNLSKRLIVVTLENSEPREIPNFTSESFYNKKGFYILHLTIGIAEKKIEIKFEVDSSLSYTLGGDFELIQDNNNLVVKKLESNFNNKDLKSFNSLNLYGKKSESPILKDMPYYKNILPKYTPGKSFVDEDFPPEKRSLTGHDKKGNPVQPHFKHAPSNRDMKDIKFFTPNEIFLGAKYHLIKDRIESSDVMQGQNIGNCYLMSILSTLGQRPDIIQNIFLSTKTNKDGFYQIFYYDENGQKCVMFVDHYIPCVHEDGIFQSTFGAQPNDEEMWVLILEKAYAKYEGGYNNIELGLTLPELYWLTGAICQKMKVTFIYAWENLRTACKNKNVLCCNSKKGKGSHSTASIGNIANSHSYSILGADEYQGIKLIKLRNPWGYGEWKGDFSDNSALWTPELKKYFGYEAAKGGNGIFFMKFEDFQNEFETVIICFC